MVDVALILEMNPWRDNPDVIKFDEHVKKAMNKKNKLLYEFKKESNLIFVGPRRVGKTTFFKLLIYDLLIHKKKQPKSIVYISCEILQNHMDLIDVFRFIDAKYFFLDEVTFLSGWEKSLKWAIDQGLLENKIVYVTGSSTAFLKREAFPGRNIRFIPFTPLNFLQYCRLFGSVSLKEKLEHMQSIEELLPNYSEIFKLFVNYMESGGFPKPAFELSEGGKIPWETYEEIYSWFRGDILKLGKSEEIMKGLIIRLLQTLSTPISYHSIGKWIGITHRIVREYIETLKNLMYLDLLYQIDLGKMIPLIRKEKKIYFTDPFIVRALEKTVVGRKIVDESKMAELIAFNTFKLARNIYFLKRNMETDFLVNSVKIEVKWQEKTTPRKGTIILSKKDYNKEKNIFPLPLYLLWFLKKKTKDPKDLFIKPE